MSTTQPPTESQPSGTTYATALHNLSLACLVICPVLIALPPRKFDLYSASLGTATIISANRLHRERYGTTLLQPFSSTPAQAADSIADEITSGLPTQRARAVAAELKRRREQGMSDAERERIAREREAEGEKGVLEKVWYGSEGEGWREKREKEDREKFEEGKGIGDVIMDQIWEVVNWGKPRGGDGESGASKG